MKKKDKTPKSKTIDSERRTRVLLEEISKQVHTIAEGHSILAKKLENHDEKLNDISTVVQKIDIKTDRIERELGTVKNAVMDMSKTTKDHETRISKLEEKVNA